MKCQKNIFKKNHPSNALAVKSNIDREELEDLRLANELFRGKILFVFPLEFQLVDFSSVGPGRRQ